MPGITTKSTRFELRIPNDLFERLKVEAAQAGVSMASLVLVRAAAEPSSPSFSAAAVEAVFLGKPVASPAKREVRVVEPAKRVVQVKRVKPLVASVVRGKAPTDFGKRPTHLRGQPSTKGKK